MISDPQGTAQTVRWPCKSIILLIQYFEHPTEVQQKSVDRLLTCNMRSVYKMSFLSQHFKVGSMLFQRCVSKLK